MQETNSVASLGDSIAWPIALVATLTVLSGVADALGFVFASRVWVEGRFDWLTAIKCSASFQVGAIMLWLALRYLLRLGVVSAEIQTLLWFSVTILGVALLSGRFFRWQLTDQLICLAVLAGIAWLLVRTGD